MAKQTLIAIGSALLLGGTIVQCRAASEPRLTCAGTLTNTREDGVTLGQCDLNFIHVKEMDEIERIADYPARLIRPLRTNVGFARLFHPTQVLRQITGSYTEFLRCGR